MWYIQTNLFNKYVFYNASLHEFIGLFIIKYILLHQQITHSELANQ